MTGLEHILLTPGSLDLGILVLGFFVGFATQFRTPLMLTLFLVKVVKWWFDTHPQGQEVAKKTNLDEEFKKKFMKELVMIEETLGMVDKPS